MAFLKSKSTNKADAFESSDEEDEEKQAEKDLLNDQEVENKNNKKVLASNKNSSNKKQIEKFDILFLDPPFISENLIKDLKLIRQRKIFNKNHVLIIHRERKSNDNINEIINTIIVKTYGRSRIVFAKFLD